MVRKSLRTTALINQNECITFPSFYCWNDFFYGCKWMLSVRLNKDSSSTKPALPIGWICFTLRTVQAYNLSSKLSTQAYTTSLYISLQERDLPTQLAWEREPRGSKLAGKVTNFYWYHIIWYGFLYKELVVRRVTAGGCGHKGCLTAPPKLS